MKTFKIIIALFITVTFGQLSKAQTLNMKLDGKLQAESVLLTVSSFPDYVFEPDYQLLPLNQVENYIKSHGHLPKMPSEKQVVDQGMDIKSLNITLVEKVEELTLYLIEQNKQLKSQAGLIEQLKLEVAKLNLLSSEISE